MHCMCNNVSSGTEATPEELDRQVWEPADGMISVGHPQRTWPLRRSLACAHCLHKGYSCGPACHMQCARCH